MLTRFTSLSLARSTVIASLFIASGCGSDTATDAGADDASTAADAAQMDAGSTDAGRDDAGPVDSGLDDAGLDDAGADDDAGLETDAGLADSGLMDAGMVCMAGQACSDSSPCDEGDRCYTGSAPENAFCADFFPECGGFPMTPCMGGRVCLRAQGSSLGYCATAAERSCICSRVASRGGSVDGC